MGYNGETYIIPCSRGGFNANPNVDDLPPEAFVHPSRNINLHNGGRETRGGTARVNGTAVTGTPQIMGLHQFRLPSGSEFTVFATSDGKIYKNFTDTIKTGWGTNKFTSFEVYAGEIYISNGFNTPEYWNGSAGTTSPVTTNTDWAGGLGPKQLVRYGYTKAERMVAIGAGNGENIYITPVDQPKDFSDVNVKVMRIKTGDGFGVMGAAQFGNRFLLAGKNKFFILDLSPASENDWRYEPVQWEGGVASFRLLIKTPNDLVAMAEDGEIYSVVTAQEFGDYKRASLARPAFMHKWIEDNIDLTKIDQFHGLYDPVLRAIKLFVVRKGQTQVNTALVYFIDRGPQEGWSIHDNQNFNSGYKASVSALFRVGSGDFKVYTGDYAGFIWKLEQTDANDNGNAYYNGFKTSMNAFGNIRADKFYDRIRLVRRPQGNYDAQVKIWVDNQLKETKLYSLSGTGAKYGTSKYGQAVYVTQDFIDDSQDFGNVGKRLQCEVFMTSVNQKFYVSSIMIDHRVLGVSP